MVRIMTLCYITIRNWKIPICRTISWNNVYVIYFGGSKLPFSSKKRPIDAPTKEEMIDELVKVCIKYNVEYDSFHNHIPSFTGLESEEIQLIVCEEVELQKKWLISKL